MLGVVFGLSAALGLGSSAVFALSGIAFAWYLLAGFLISPQLNTLTPTLLYGWATRMRKSRAYDALGWGSPLPG